MPIRFECPHCKGILTVKDDHAGKRGTCPGCTTPLVVPPQSTAPPAKHPHSHSKPVPSPAKEPQQDPPQPPFQEADTLPHPGDKEPWKGIAEESAPLSDEEEDSDT